MQREISKQQLIKASDEYLKIWRYIVELPNGAIVEYQTLEDELGIKMNQSNRLKFHHACVQSGRAYQLIRGIGYKFADGNNAIGIVNEGIGRVGNSITRLRRTHINIKIDVYEEMTPEDKQRFNFTESFTNAISSSIENNKRLKELNKPKQISEAKPLLPD
jgi:hypothetical protein